MSSPCPRSLSFSPNLQKGVLVHFVTCIGFFLAIPASLGLELPTGTWRLTQYLVDGESTKRPFAFLRIHEDGRSEVSSGVEKLPCRLHLVDGSFEFNDPSGLGWQPDRFFWKTDGFFRHAGSSLILVDPSLDQRDFTAANFPYTEDSFTSASEVYRFEKAGDVSTLDAILDRGDPALTAYIDRLVQLNAGFSVNLEGEITEISFTNCSAEEIDIALLEKLPSLRSIRLAENSIPVPQSERIEIEVRDLSGDREWKSKNETAGGKLLHEGRRNRAVLSRSSETSSAPPVFSARSRGEAPPLATSLVSFRGKAFAFHHQPLSPGDLPFEMVHQSLGSPVPLGRAILSRLGFLVREITGTPGPEWLFEPIPEAASIFENGQVLHVHLPDGSVHEGVTRVEVAHGIAPGGRVDWGTVEVFLGTDPGENLQPLMGCPVLDARSGHLVGFVQNAFSDTGVKIEINTFSDLTALPEPPSQYVGVSFFGIPGRLSPEEVSSHLVGVFRSDFAAFPLGQGHGKDYLLARPHFHDNNLMEFPGREYLFSKIEFKNPTVLNELKAVSIRLRNDDQRLRKFAAFLLSHLGPPTQTGGTFPDGDGKFGKRISMRWEGKKFTVYFEIAQQKIGNWIIATFEVGKTNAIRPPKLTSIDRDQTGGLHADELLKQYFAWLDTLDPEIDFNGFHRWTGASPN